MPGLTRPYPLVCRTALQVAQRFLGVSEVPGSGDNPMVLAMLRLDGDWPEHDEVPWCSAFLNFVAWILDLPRSRSLAARSWLDVGTPVSLEEALPAFDVVVLSRTGDAPGPHVVDAPGHVGFFVDTDDSRTMVRLLSGNTSNKVTYSTYPASRVLGVRRLKL